MEEQQQKPASFLIAGSIYGGNIKLLTDTHVVPVVLVTFDSTSNIGMFILNDEHEKVLDARTIYITYTSDHGDSVHHIIEPVTDVKKENTNTFSFKGKLAI